MRTLDFVDHRRELADNRYVYAVVSRRAGGLSIGINLNPDKVCNFDCPYCQVDRTTPGGARDVDIPRLKRELDHLLGLISADTLWSVSPFNTAAPAHRRVCDISIAGDGEPTTCPQLADAIEVVGRARADHALDHVRLQLFTNATLLHRPAIALALGRWADLGGELWAKLDAGTQAWFERVDGTGLSLDRVEANILASARAQPLILQCMFVALGEDTPDYAEITAWLERLERLRAGGAQIALVQVYTSARAPADPSVRPLPPTRLAEIGARVARLGLPVQVVA